MFNWIAQGKTTTIDIDDILRGSEYSLNKFTGNSSDASRFVNFSTTHNLNNTSQSFPFAGSSFPGGYVFYNFPSNDTYPNSVNETANYFTINAIDLYYYVSESSTSTDVATVEFLFPPIKYHKYASSSHSVTAVSPSTCYLYSIELNTHPYNWYYFDYPASNYSTSTDTHTWQDKFGDTGSESTTATAPKIVLTLKKDNLTYLNRNSVKAIPSGYVSGPAYDGWVELIMDCCVKGTVTNGSSSKTGAYKTRIKIKLIKLKAISEGDSGENKFFLGNKCPTEIYITNNSGGLVAVKEVYLGSVKVWPFTGSDPETDIKDIFFRLRLRLNKFNFYFMGNESECVGTINDGSVFVSIDFTIINPAELDDSDKPIVFNSYASYNVRFAGDPNYVGERTNGTLYIMNNVPTDFFTNNAVWCHKVLTGYYTSPLIDKIYSNSGNSLGYTQLPSEYVNENILLEKNYNTATVKTIDIKYYNPDASTDVFEHATCGPQGQTHARYNFINVSSNTCENYLRDVSPFCMITLKFNFCLPHPKVETTSSYYYDTDSSAGDYYNIANLVTEGNNTDSTLQRRIKLNYQGQQHIFKLSDIYGLASQRLMNNNSKEHGVVGVIDALDINSDGTPAIQSYDDDNINNYYGYLNSYEYSPIALGNDPGTAGLSFAFDVNIVLRQNINPEPDPVYPPDPPSNDPQKYAPPIYKNVTWSKSIDTETNNTISNTYSNGTQEYYVTMNDTVGYNVGIQTNYTYDPPTSLHFSISSGVESEGADIILWVYRQNNSNVGSNRFEDLYLYIKKNCRSSVVTKKEGYNDWNGDPLSGANIITYAAGAPTGYSTPNTSIPTDYNPTVYNFHGWSLTSGRYCNIPKNPQGSSGLISCTGGDLYGIAHLELNYSTIELAYMTGSGTGRYLGTGVTWYHMTYIYVSGDYVSFRVTQDPITKQYGGSGTYFSGGTIVSGVVSSTGGTSYGGIDPSTGH